MKTEGTLVVLTPGFAADETDSTCLPMQQSLLRKIREMYPSLNVVVLSFQYPYQVKEYKWKGIKVFSFNGQNKGGVKRLLLRRKILACLRQLHSSEKIIGLLSFWYNECAAVGEIFAISYGVKHFCWLLGQDVRKGNKYVKRIRLCPGKLIALSDFVRDEFKRNYGLRPLQVIPPGFNPNHHQLTNPAKDIDLVAVGSLIPLKQYDHFVLAVAEIKKQIPGLKAVMVGDGPEKEKLQQLIHKYSLCDTIQLVGECSHNEVIQWLQRSKVLLHPSSYEGFGVACLEALYCRADVISYVQPMNEKINRWHVVRSKEELILQAISCLKHPAAYEYDHDYSMEATARKMVTLFSSE